MPWSTRARDWRLTLPCLVLALSGGAAQAAPDTPDTPDARDLPSAVHCEAAPDTLARVRCRGEIRIGVRAFYPPFSQSTADGPQGFEPALARLLAARLGVGVRFVEVDAANRMVTLGDGRVDLLIATTGHTSQRDGQALFVRPHYYESHTVVVGLRSTGPPELRTLSALAGRTVCVTIGNSTNAELAVNGARLMLFGTARALVEQLQAGTCPLAAHDDSLLLPLLPASYEVKLSFAPLPWGVVVRRDGAPLASLLARELRQLHADGTLLRLAHEHDVPEDWLEAQRRRWSSPPCDAPAALEPAPCLDPPRDNHLAPTPIADAVERLEDWLQEHWRLEVTLAMLKTRVALRLFLEGIGYSVALVVGAVLSTVLLALGFGAGLTARSRALRWPLRGVLLTTQSTPMVLMMTVAGLLLSGAGQSTPATASLVAVVVLGLFNGSNAGQAVAEARRALRDEGRSAGLRAAALRARAQIAAFAVNATRGTPVASLIGVPELLAAQTDIASFSSRSTTTFALLLVFYMALVSLVVALLHRVESRLQAAPTAPRPTQAPQ
ncbi:transporter substrate-binding domain-containing protein [Roseateles sp. UC29_93]|uniref:transporter substrate-binding domain-containing protein n=1 Tax=Roseateles sp. UC29_93 TaxID=3350177 RepID=UPI00366E95BB